MRVKELMTEDPTVCTRQDTLDDAVARMLEHDCGSLPVVAGEGQKEVVGMITDRDICIAAHHEGKRLQEIRVDAAMSHDVVVCTPEEDISRASEKMRRAQVRRLPVMGESGIVGLLTLGQIARIHGEAPGADDEGVADTLSAISQPPGSASASARPGRAGGGR